MNSFFKNFISAFQIDINKYNKIKEKACIENMQSLSKFSFLTMLTFLCLFGVSFFLKSYERSKVMFAVYALVGMLFFLVSTLGEKKLEKYAFILTYLFMAALWLYGIILGTIIYPERMTVSFIVFLFVVPLLFVGRPIVINCMTFAAILIYIFIGYHTQERSLLLINLNSIIPFGVIGCFVSTYMMKIKIHQFFYKKQTHILERADQQASERMRDYEQFITEMIRFASSEGEPDEVINQLMKYIGEKLNSDRAYIFEDNLDGTFDNTYEWCKEGVSKEIDNLKNVPYENMLEVWFEQYRRSHNILIYDIEEYRKVSEPMYQLLKPQGIQTLVTGPISIGGKMIGFYGVDNPPVELMNNVSELIEMMEFVVSMMIRLRDNARTLEESATRDQLTDCKNRKALNWAYDGKYNQDQAMAVVMCDLNGLKAVNDKQGHVAGDRFICRTAEILKDVFGKENVYRMGGDEFVVVLLGETREALNTKKELAGIQIGNSASLGYTYEEHAGNAFEAMLKTADDEMYKNKKEHYEQQLKQNKEETMKSQVNAIERSLRKSIMQYLQK